ncbi:MAG: tetratricopeptide repeat protein [Verrucomicrobiota bacterium]
MPNRVLRRYTCALMKWMLLVLFFTISFARAEGPDQEYIEIYNLIEQADTLGQNNLVAATARYREAQAALKRLQSVYPKWNENVIKFRLDYVAKKLKSTGQTLVPTNAAPSTNATGTTPKSTQEAVPNAALKEDLRQLQEENAKLKEASSTPPIVTGANDLAKVQEQLVAVQKERDLLKVALEQTPPAQEATSGSGNEKEIEQLRARLEALEARPVPYTAEELALFKPTAPQLAPAESKPAKKSKELPAGAGAIVAQAERAFAAQRFDEAEQKYLEVLRQDDKNVHILGNLAATQLEMNRVPDAEKNINAALEIDPDDAFSLTLLGMIKFRAGKFDDALNVLSRSAKIDPKNPETQNYLGITLSQKGQRVPAEAALRKAIQLQPDYAGAHHNLAVIYAAQRPPFFELARWHYQRALTLGHSKNPELEKMLADK